MIAIYYLIFFHLEVPLMDNSASSTSLPEKSDVFTKEEILAGLVKVFGLKKKGIHIFLIYM